MINFRFHLVSLVAVFLALAIGVVMGSTVIDRAIVEGLRAQIEAVERRADERREENLALKSRLDALEGYIDQAIPHLVVGRLADVPVAVVAVRGIDGVAVRETVLLLQASGAAVAGVAWIEPPFALADVGSRARLGDVLGDTTSQGDDLRRAGIEALGRRLALGPAPPADGPTARDGAGDLLAALGDAGFLKFESLPGSVVDLARWPQPGARVLVIDGPEGTVDAQAASVPLVRVLAEAGAPVALAEVFSPTAAVPSRGGVVRSVRDDQSLAAMVATVDDLDEPRGRAAVTLAVEELGRGRAGHYGEGRNASRQLPEPEAAGTGAVPGS